MGRAKYRHRLWCFDYFQFEQAEAWLMDMAAAGWRLKSVRRLAKFERCEPAVIRYRCLWDDFTYYVKRNEALQEYARLGWVHVASVSSMLVLSAPDSEEIPELPLDAGELGDRMGQTLRERFIGYLLLMFFFLLFIAVIAYLGFTGNSPRQIVMAIFSAFASVALVGLLVGIFLDAKSTLRRLNHGQITHRQPYGRIIVIASITIYSVCGVYLMMIFGNLLFRV